MNFQDLKKNALSSSQSQQEKTNLEEMEKTAIENNPALRELDNFAKAELSKMENILLTRALGVSQESYATLKREQDLQIKQIESKVNLLLESNRIMSDTIKGEVASITEETNRTALLFRKTMFDEITTTNKKSCEEMQTIIRQAKDYYSERKTLDWAVIFLLIVNMFGVFMIARNIGMI